MTETEFFNEVNLPAMDANAHIAPALIHRQKYNDAVPNSPVGREPKHPVGKGEPARLNQTKRWQTEYARPKVVSDSVFGQINENIEAGMFGLQLVL